MVRLPGCRGKKSKSISWAVKISAEQSLCRSLRECLAGRQLGECIGDSDSYRDFLNSLEYFIPEVLVQVHSAWRSEGLDGVLPLLAIKRGEREIELAAYCILIRDQTMAPLYLRMQLAADVDEVAWLECRFGERGPQGMIRLPYAQPNRLDKKLYACIQQGDTKGIAWAFGATFDARREGEAEPR